ncbi:alpha/beta hydrolase fold-domain-containing protein [Nemania sp. FL0031]|nr:alpha/beta hydrolase fold-domain-containing protein [Nemania sp. FL0031]
MYEPDISRLAKVAYPDRPPCPAATNTAKYSQAHEQVPLALAMANKMTPDERAAELKKARNKMAWAVLPKIPHLIRLFFARLLGLSETARYLSLKTDMTLTIFRSMLSGAHGSKPQTVTDTQAMSCLDPGVKGKLWVSNTVSDVPPEGGIREALMSVIRSMADSEAQAAASFRVPDIVPVEAEWTGYRSGAGENDPLPDISEEQKYEEMMKECNNATTVLFFHGGAYYLCDPATHRPLAMRLAKEMGGRVYSVRYRLAPQHPFPAALLDALVSYFTLLYPPPGSIHEAVSPRDIVLGGDSAGGNLAAVLTQTLLQLHRQGTKIAWFGVKRRVPLPAGVTLVSPWLDITQSMPSWSTNQKWDYLPHPSAREKIDYAPCPAWPASPPRTHLYVDDALRTHPLVSAHLAPSWAGAPPVWVVCGWECLADEARYFVAKLRAGGVRVAFEEYEAMPHDFIHILPSIAESERCFQGWARFITATRKEPEGIEASYTYIKAKTLEESEGDVEKLTPYDEEGVRELVAAKLRVEDPNMVFTPRI